MSGKIIDGKVIAKKIRKEIEREVKFLKDKTNRVPGLAVILVGDDKASHRYVAMKEKACEEVGIKSIIHRLDKDTKEEGILDLIDQLNRDEDVNGILVQLPLPKGIDEKKVNLRVSSSKDVDGFHPYNTGRLFLRDKSFIPCTPKGIIKLIKSTGERIEGKKAVVIGRSNIVGKPTGLLLLNENATVTICHSKTTDIEDHIKRADILVVAVGIPEFVKGNMIKEGSIVIDAGINVINGRIIGDVEFEEAKERASWITPVPGGVGPMTIAMLLENTLEAFKEKWL